MKLYTILDKIAQAYKTPFNALNDGMAIRMFAQVVNDNNPDNAINKNPQDFILYVTGEFDEQTGITMGNDTGPIQILHGSEVVEHRQETVTPAIQELLTRIETCVTTIRNHQTETYNRSQEFIDNAHKAVTEGEKLQ